MRLAAAFTLLTMTSCDARRVDETPLSAIPPFELSEGQELVATCGSSKGHAYYAEIGIAKGKAGWTEDSISKGYFYIVKQPSGYDVVFHDATEQRTSAVADGAAVEKFRQGPSDIAFSVIYRDGGKTAEIYTLYREDDGTERFTNLVSKGGEGPIYKSGVMTGVCRGLRLDA